MLGLPFLGIEEVESEQVKVAFLQAGEAKLEPLEPLSAESAVAKVIEKRGEGIQHVALGVEDITERIRELKEHGIRMIQDAPKRGAGHRLERFGRRPHSRRGLVAGRVRARFLPQRHLLRGHSANFCHHGAVRRWSRLFAGYHRFCVHGRKNEPNVHHWPESD
ncbi:Methylmalonyl-CoA epimerase [Geobacillus stearothermophilus]|uniref:Methylmalonyl-CoA epimerase n=1 Tax=Geobacillus stearothermophilus TaxID=1422 RepID=A0ABQ7HCI6_GEOSE|nr:Methylmalonyl-CoA epimerase [Geobacillus stearothermophilus]OAO82694.1 Methylmalonyl-CoA epimerase [Geobacillus stearothermophilus]